MGNYSTQDFIDTFGGLPERGDRNWAGPDPGELEDQDVLVGCVCNGGKTYARGIMPGMCGHCHGTGSLPRSKYRAITAPKSEKDRPS